MIVVSVLFRIQVFVQDVRDADASTVDAFFEVFSFFELIEEFVSFSLDYSLEKKIKKLDVVKQVAKNLEWRLHIM